MGIGLRGKGRLIFAHIQKCAGTTIYQSLAPLFEQAMTSHDGSDAVQHGDSAPFISTHQPVYMLDIDPQSDYLITSLRDPAERLVSLFRFWAAMKLNVVARNLGFGETFNAVKAAHTTSFADFLSCTDPLVIPQIDNAMVRHFVEVQGAVTEVHLEAAKEKIQRVNAFIFVETLEADLARVFRILRRQPVGIMVKGNITEQLLQDNPREYRRPINSLEEFDFEAFIELIEPRIRFDAALYSYAVALHRERSREKNPVFAGLRGLKIFEVVPDVRYLSSHPLSRGLFWGEWSSVDDSRVWSLDEEAELLFKVRRSNLKGLRRPALNIQLRAHLPPNRRHNIVDVELGSNKIATIAFLPLGGCVNLSKSRLKVDGGRLIICAGGEVDLEVQLSSVIQDMPAENDEDFCEFSLMFKNHAVIPADVFEVGDGRCLGISVESVIVTDSD